ncbi:MAG TPA: 3-methyl-2-oxobutanoate hydroxymethyltransferase [Nitrospiraceae bacterium]|nr:3-methyl-2-oxobutanoate hydroxymethyltransferase [Nitrospiraceae bacterium]
MPKITANAFLQKKAEHQKITMITAYDYPFAMIADEAGIDAILVGDSLAMVVQGLDTTLPVTMDEMIYHTKIVSRAVKNAMVIGDMPFLSYQISVEDTVRNGGRFLKEAGASAVKIEGGAEVKKQIKALVEADIPVIAHIGLMPQAIHRMGGYKVQGKTQDAAERLIEDAQILVEAGAFAIVLEAIPLDLARRITDELVIPTIGIGAGPHCDGQVLVMHDVLGLYERFAPKFIKRYANLKEQALKAIQTYKEEVEKGIFPSTEQSFQ